MDGMILLKIVLVICFEGVIYLGGVLIKVKSIVEILKLKVVFCVGCCGVLNFFRIDFQLKLGDVVIFLKLIMYVEKIVMDNGVQFFGLCVLVGRDIGGIIRYVVDGWEVLLKNKKVRKINVFCSGEFLSGFEEIDLNW